MKTFNTRFEDKASLKNFLIENNIKDSKSVLVQVFIAFNDLSIIENTLKSIKKHLPSASIIGSTTDGEIINGEVTTNQIIISISVFEKTQIETKLIKRLSNCKETGKQLAKELIKDNTKAIITFTDGLHTNGEHYLKAISSVNKNVIIAGGMAGDRSTFKETFVFNENEITDNGAVAVALNSDSLYIHTDYNFDWKSIGKKLKITKADKNRVYTIDNKTAYETYAYFLGEELAQELPAVGIEFPLIVKRNDVRVARAVLAKEDDGSLIFAGNLKEGEDVQIGFGNAEMILNASYQNIEKLKGNPAESIFIYSCMARRRFMPTSIKTEIEPLEKIAPTCGFFTYGEFYDHGPEDKELLNQTMTIFALSESKEPANIPEYSNKEESQAEKTMKALSHIINTTSDELVKTNIRLNHAIEGSQDGLWEWDIDNNKIYFSSRWKEILGYQDNELKNNFSEWKDRIHPDDKEKFIKNLNKCMEGKSSSFNSVYRLKHKNGKYIWIQDRAKVFYDEKNKSKILSGFQTDITEQKENENKIEEQRVYLQSIIDGIDDPIMIIEKDNSIKLTNKAAQKFIKNDSGKPMCHQFYYRDNKPCDNLRQENCPIQKVFFSKKSYTFNHKRTDKDGATSNMEISISPLWDRQNNMIGVVEVAHDISTNIDLENKINEQQNILKHQAYHDSLTNLPNKALFLDRLRQSIKKAKRDFSALAVLFIDIDNFKKINDSMGHSTGDQVLVKISKILKSTLRESDTIARLSGDEFIVILDNIKNTDFLVDITQKTLEQTSLPLNINGREIYITCSIGISVFPEDGYNAETLLKNADAAMYKAKEDGKNTYQFYKKEMTEKAFERIVMETNLRQAYENEEFKVYFQPQVTTKTKKIEGFEALLRWSHPSMGLIPPSKFIPLAEELGLIIKLDRWVMRNAIEQIMIWKEKYKEIKHISLNLSIKQLEQNDFIEFLENLLKETDCPPALIELEITESHIIKDIYSSIETLNKIKKLGINISIDDFGTGYSSLAYLKRLPISKIKIDQSFVRDIPYDDEDIAITKTIIALAQNLGLKTVAEGVETKEQEEFMREHSCDSIQGFFYSKALNAKEAEEFIKNNLKDNIV